MLLAEPSIFRLALSRGDSTPRSRTHLQEITIISSTLLSPEKEYRSTTLLAKIIGRAEPDRPVSLNSPLFLPSVIVD